MLKMKQRQRIYYSDAQKALMWERWQKGESMNAIGRFFDRGHSSIQRILLERGGLPPAPKKRSRLSLTLAEREEISRGVVADHSLRSIAA
jgi:hypothetical protein